MNKPIGVFDSGLGGLTFVKEIKELMPREDIVYLGDTGRVPYGTKSVETIGKYTLEDINFLQKHDVKCIVVACGTASSVGVSQIPKEFSLPLFTVIEPTAKKAIDSTKNGNIGIIATSTTINSKSYENEILKLAKEENKNVKVFSKACPLFVPLIENGRTSIDDTVTNTVIEEYLTDLKKEGIDTLILGCTHYPLISQNISNFFDNKITLINPSLETALSVSLNIDKSLKDTSNDSFFVTDDVKNFNKNAESFLGKPISATLIKEL